MRNYDEKQSFHTISFLRSARSRTQSLNSIDETDEDSSDVHDSTAESTQPSSDGVALRILSSNFTTPGRLDSDDGPPPRDSFSATLYSKLLNVASISIRSSSTSSISSAIYFSPGSDHTSNSTQLPAARLKRRATTSPSPSPGKENHKRLRIKGPSLSKLKRVRTLTDDGEQPVKRQRFGTSRLASLRRADSLKSEWIPTAPSTPPAAPSSPGVPIIAPPLEFTLPLPSTARSRLNAYIQRERAWWTEFSFGRVHGDVQAWDSHLGLGVRVRATVMNWIAEVRFGMYEMDEEDEVGEDEYSRGLADQLAEPETRFHAAYLFLLFAFRKGWGGWKVWDLATACVAVSAKYHHDFLLPLLPLYASDILRLPPHCMYADDLESAQRLLLQTLSYKIGATTSPSGILRELWDAIPAAQDLLSRQKWDYILSETWRILLVAIIEPDVLQFPISLLTASVVVDRCQDVLKCNAESEDLEGLLCDLEATLQLKRSDMERCRRWLTEVLEAAQGR